MDNIKLSVVIPAYNEAKNLNFGVLNQVYDYLKDQTYSYEVLIVDDGSTDETREIVEENIKYKKGFNLIRNPHGGKALTVISGLLKARGEIALFTDMDQATPIDQIEKFFPKFNQGYDIVIGSRGGRKGAPFIRKFIAWGFSLLRDIMLGLPIRDTQCGFKAFTKGAIKATFPKMLDIWQKKVSSRAAVNAGFDVELLYLAKKSKLRIAEVPVKWQHVSSESIKPMQDAIETILDMFRIRMNDFYGEYG